MTDPKTALLAVAAMCIGGLAFSIYSGHAVMFMAGLMMGAILCVCIINVIIAE